MFSTFPFSELEADPAAIEQFSRGESERTEAALCDATYDEDVARIQDLLRTDTHLTGLRRRGSWLYSWLQNADHPKGLWRRIPETSEPRIDADWQQVFDLEAFCRLTGTDWHWRGAETAFFDGDKLLLCLSLRGSDKWRYLEWDPAAQAQVPNGFDLGPERNRVCWLDRDTVLYSTSTPPEEAATRSGWPRRVLRLQRGMKMSDAEAVFEVDHDDLQAVPYAFPAPDGTVAVTLSRVRVIGDTDVTLYPRGLDGDAILLPTPRDTHAIASSTHYAFVAATDGPHPPGALVLCEVGKDGQRVVFTPKPYSCVDAATVHVGDRWMLWIELDRTRPALQALDLGDEMSEPVTIPLPCAAEAVRLLSHDAAPSAEGPWQLVSSGFLDPPTTWLFDLEDGPAGVRFRKLFEEPPSFDAEGMKVRLHKAVSDDGTEVPYHIVLPSERDGALPVLQYGYGGFGSVLSPTYQRLRGPLWLSRGGAFVMAYGRGGGEFGKAWHHAAKGQARIRAFEDFAAVASDLVARGYTTPERVACHGHSNGGLLCAVMLVRYPDRFGAVWAGVPVTDMLRFHLFPAGAGWIDEYGDPDAPTDRDHLLAYSPLHNIAPAETRRYPRALIATNDSDDRVDPSHSRRFAAALHAAGHNAFFRANTGGHGGASDLSGIARELALGYAFLRYTLGVRGTSSPPPSQNPN